MLQPIIRNYLSESTIYNGLLLFHGTGSGKTCSSILIAENYLNNDDIKSNKKVYIISSEKLHPQFKKEIYNPDKIPSQQCLSNKYFLYRNGKIDQKEIDKKNILNSTFIAMHKAIENLSIKPNFILVDGNKFKRFKNIPYKCMIMGDQKYQNIAAASILAKTYRDEYMKKIDIDFPNYDWGRNKGYGTKHHIEMILKYGKTIHHRLSFKIKPKQLNLQFNQ